VSKTSVSSSPASLSTCSKTFEYGRSRPFREYF
jgi:hypothetical protein